MRRKLTDVTDIRGKGRKTSSVMGDSGYFLISARPHF
jgi:hypothetical protein